MPCARLTIALLALLTGSLTAGAALATGLSPALEARLATAAPSEEIAVIVRLADRVDLASFPGRGTAAVRRAVVSALRAKAERSQRPLLAELRVLGVRSLRRLWAINALAIETTPEKIRAVAALPGIEVVSADLLVSAPLASAGMLSTPEWNLAMVGAPDMWALGYDGSGIVVANLDTGVDPDHPDLAGRWRGGSNSWFDAQGTWAQPHDSRGHGTQTMGLIVGGDAGGTAIGMAPGATWIAAKIFDSAGNALLSEIHAGFQWLLDPDGDAGSDDAPDVVNASFGFPQLENQCFLEFEQDIALLKAVGIAIAFSAGNTGPSSASSHPAANNPSGFAVGSVDDASVLASKSSRGPGPCDEGVFPEVVAPGVNVLSADLTFGGVFPDSYAHVTGTSFAAPHAAGAMALLLSAHPGVGVAELEQAIEDSALDLGISGPDDDSGFGRVDVPAAHAILLPEPGFYWQLSSGIGLLAFLAKRRSHI